MSITGRRLGRAARIQALWRALPIALLAGMTGCPCPPGVYNDPSGDPEAYYLPFPAGVGSWVGQGNLGRFSHAGGYAIDFSMPVHTPIAAARAGTVVDFQADRTENCWPSGDCGWNFVSIEHDDGTIATYGHLEPQGVLVASGQRIARGEVIAFSGNTGYSFTPHLHFEVADPAGGAGAADTIPIRFADVCGDGIPQAGVAYVSANAVPN